MVNQRQSRAWRIAIGLFAGMALLAAPIHSAEPTPKTIDVIFLYSQDVSNRYGSGVDTRIDHIVGVANDAFQRSEAGMRLRAVHSQEVSYSGGTDSGTALDDFTANRGVFSGVEQLRNQYGADMAVFLRPYAGDGICGIAWVGGYKRNGNLNGSNRYAYSHVSVDCSDYVLGHELGHNLGLSHSRRQDGSGGTYPWALGHGANAKFVTMMAYGSSFSGAPKVHVFSNPTLTCAGQPCGVNKSASTGADASDSLRSVAAQVASYRPTVVADVGGASLDILGPNRNSVLEPGGTYPISWNQTGVDSVNLSYRIEGQSAFFPIAQSVSGSRYTWTIPASIAGRTVRVMADGFTNGVSVASTLSEIARVNGQVVTSPPKLTKKQKKRLRKKEQRKKRRLRKKNKKKKKKKRRR